jgi:membrane associated rhomboid family serine protease
MEDHFLVSWAALADGRWWTLLGSAFSHNMFWHLFLNMYVLSSFGAIVQRLLGARRFIMFYLVTGIVSSLSHCVVSAWIVGDPTLPALGASGAVSGMIILFSLMFPKEKLLLLGLIPMPALAGALLFVGIDIWGLISQAEGGGLPIGHGAHLGGALTGFIYYFLVIRPKLLNRRQHLEI